MIYRTAKKINRRNSGQAMIISIIFFLFISIAIISGLVSPSIRHFKSASDMIKSRQSFFASESLMEDVFFRLKNGLAVDDTEILGIGTSSATASVTDSAYNEKTISVLGDESLRQRKNEIVLTTGVGVSFSYGVHVGTGGLTMENNSSIQGSVYANGRIQGSGSITGTAFSANSPALNADQVNDTGIPTYDVVFGNANGTQDFGQSFQVSTAGQVNKVDLYIRKVSTPGNLNVRIASNAGTVTIASGTLLSSSASTSYGWVSVPVSPNADLSPGVVYWVVLDGVTNSSRYYVMGANDNGYANGIAKLGQYGGSWSNTSPAGLDGFFKIYTGGILGAINGITIGSGGVGNAYANNVSNSVIAGTNYCKTGTGNNKPCNTSLPDPTQVSMPISDQDISLWQSEAEAGGIHSGDYILNSSTGSIGPIKITGNLTIENNADLTVNGTIWVEGNMTVSNNATVRLSPSYSASEGVIVVDGTVNISNNATFSGSGTSGSYLMVLSNSTSTSAIYLSNNGGAVILYAANGTVRLANNATAKSLNGKYIHLDNNAVVIYDSGLANANFVNGPSGGWNISSWQEVDQ